ncbi:protein kinase [uncultured Nocardioides sp.]|uniref:protein kinase domain-containing protein n=1 Tax=uncultured Nocardioides sp. TaxID=198441 RepID=UPI00262D644A|nr:protein kinase [uncultured Nocardioides sp.]
MALRAGDTVGRYRLEREIGRGGMGVVFAAADPGLQRAVAVKVMSGELARSPQFRSRFAREATALARLDSPHVVAVHDHGEYDAEDGPAPYLVTRLVEGGDLGTLLAQRGPLPPQLAARVCAQVAEAVRDAHRVGIVHRDLKPANVLLRDPDDPQPFAYLCDFGIATVESGDGTAQTRATVGVAGTWGYLSPERIHGAPGTPASDVYGLGCLLWAALTGGPPYRGSDWEVAEAHHRAPPPQTRGQDPLSRELDAVLAATMDKDPSRRPDAETVRARLAAAAEGRTERTDRPYGGPPYGAPPFGGPPYGGPPYGGPPGPPSYAPGPASAGGRRRSPGLVVGVVAAVVVLLVAAGLTGWALWPDGGSTEADGGGSGDGGSETDGTTGESGGSEDGGGEPARAVTGDLDGDGLGDLLLQTGRTVESGRERWLSEGDVFADPAEEPGARGIPLRGDVDGDGGTDIVTVSRGSLNPRVAVELASGETVRSTRSVTQVDVVYSVVADFDGDGLDDLGTWGPREGFKHRIVVFRSLGDGKFGAGQELTTDVEDGFLQPGDYDGDGMADFAVLRTDASPATIELLFREGNGFEATEAPFDAEGAGTGTFVRSGDFDGDGVDELVDSTVEAGTRLVRVWDAAEDRTATPTEWLSGEAAPEEQVLFVPTVGDFDGDGHDDLQYWRTVAEGGFAFDVALSDGSSFADPTEWGQWQCEGAECFRPAVMLDNANR